MQNYELYFNLRNEFDEENDQLNKINFQLQSNMLQISLHNLCKYSQLLQEEYIINEIIRDMKQKLHKCQSTTNIKEENILIFLNMFQKEEITINNDIFFDFCKLSEIFKVSTLQRCLKKYSEQHSNDIDFLLNMILRQQQESAKNDNFFSNDQYLAEIEKILSDKINECLQNENFEKLPISTIHRIIDKSDLNQISNDKLYDFISKKIEERHILFSFLNLQCLSNEKFTEMYNNYSISNDCKAKSYYNYLQNDLKFIKQLKDNEEKLLNQIQKLKSQINKSNDDNAQLKSQIDQLQEEKVKSNQLNSQLQNQMKILEGEKIQLQNKMDRIENKMKEEEELRKKELIEYHYDRNNPFNGILKHLTNVTNGNIHKNKTIEISGSKVCCGPIENLVDFNNYKKFVHLSESPKPFWLQIDFKQRKIQIKSYLIRSRDSGGSNLRFLKTWSVEISNNGCEWQKIDERENVSELNGQDFMNLFEIHMKHEPFRFIRIITDKNNWSVPYGNQGFAIGKLEFFGNIIE